MKFCKKTCSYIESNINMNKKVNCGCIPCKNPVNIINGKSNIEKSIPILVDKIENCMCIKRFERAYTVGGGEETPLALRINLTGEDVNLGDIVCINSIKYSYDCVGPAFLFTDEVPAQPYIFGYVNGKEVLFTAKNPSCVCSDSNNPNIGFYVAKDFVGRTITDSCACYDSKCSRELKKENYIENKIVEPNIYFGVCNFTITVFGTIGGKCFSGLVGLYDIDTTTFQQLNSALSLSALEFQLPMNFTGKMCLPTNTKIKFDETFDVNLGVDCIRPIDSTLNNLEPTLTNPVVFAISAELYLSINKTINAIINERKVSLTNSGSSICFDNK